MAGTTSTTGRGKRRLRGDGNGWDEQGGYMQAKIRKLEKQFTADRPLEIKKQNSSSSIFNGIAIFVNGYTIPSSDDLKKLMLQHGGMFHHYYTRSKVTHIIASNLPNSKIDKIHDKKIVKPEWITDSVKAGKCLPYEHYLLYTARSTVQPGLVRYASTGSVTSEPPSAPDAPNPPGNATDCTFVEESVPRSNLSKADELSLSSDRDAKIGNNSPNVQIPAKSPPNLLDSSRGSAKAGDPSFIAEFYNHSRLHYLSTWGAEFRVYVNELHAKGGNSYPGRDKLMSMIENRIESDSPITSGKKCINTKTNRVFMHIDMDCFFVSVGLRNRPDLVGKPVVVTHSRGRGVKERQGTNVEFEREHYRKRAIERNMKKTGADFETDAKVIFENEICEEAETDDYDHDEEEASSNGAVSTPKQPFNSMSEIASASYEARKAGIKNGMFMGPAKQLCPDIIPIPYDFVGYREVSQKLYDTVASYTHDIEAVSCDEMLVDLSDVLIETGASALQFASVLRKEIFEKTQCNASVGIGPSILVAKLATKKAKPNGQFHVEQEDVNTFILDKTVRDLPGVGWSTSHKLQNMNVDTCKDLQRVPLPSLQKEFGPKTGLSLYRACRGEDDRAIKIEKERKSVSAEINYGIRFSQEAEVNTFIAQVAEEVHNRMNRIKVKGKTITLKLKIRAKDAPVETAKFLGHGICDNVTKSVTLPISTNNSAVIHKECMGIIKSLHIPPSEYRGVGIQISKLESAEEGSSLTAKGLQSILNFASRIDDKDKQDREVAKEVQNKHDCSGGNTEFSENQCDKSSEERRRHPSLPPLPTLPDLNASSSPQSSQNTPKTPTAKIRQMQRSAPKEEMYLLSPSQIDLNILKELPPEIRHQIEVEIKVSKRNQVTEINDVNGCSAARNTHTMLYDNAADGDGAHSGCSNWKQTGIENVHETRAGDEKEDIFYTTQISDSYDPMKSGLLYSELDRSVLAALPSEIKKEIEQQYQRKIPLNGHEIIMQAQVHKGSPIKSPKKTSPKGKNSPKFKVPTGRPPNKKKNTLSPKKLDFSKQLQFDSQVCQEIIPDVDQAERIPICKELQLELPDKTVPTKSVSSLGPKIIDLCGATGVSDVRTILYQWINSTNEPENLDVARFIQYLYDLIMHKDLEKVYLILKALKRNVFRHHKAAVEEWVKLYELVVFRTQSIIQSNYEATLKL